MLVLLPVIPEVDTTIDIALLRAIPTLLITEIHFSVVCVCCLLADISVRKVNYR